jgi:hypothetical protein
MNEKRTKALTVRVTPGDLIKLQDAARLIWPGAVISMSGVILGLARMKAEEVAASKRVRNRTPK